MEGKKEGLQENNAITIQVGILDKNCTLPLMHAATPRSTRKVDEER
jgi:hypothetical protein